MSCCDAIMAKDEIPSQRVCAIPAKSHFKLSPLIVHESLGTPSSTVTFGEHARHTKPINLILNQQRSGSSIDKLFCMQKPKRISNTAQAPPDANTRVLS